MRKIGFFVVVFLGACVAVSSAIMYSILDDPMDDVRVVAVVATRPAVAPTRAKVEALRETMLRWKESELNALFGAGGKLPAGMAMPIGQPRAISLSGIRYVDETKNHHHTEVYAIGTIGYAQVTFNIDGITPGAVIFYLRPDADFVKVTADQVVLDKRLAWEERKLDELRDWVVDRRREVDKDRAIRLPEIPKRSGG